MNQYQACLYFFECICHGDSKYCHEISKQIYFWQFCDIFEMSSASVQSINFRPNIIMTMLKYDPILSLHECAIENIAMVHAFQSIELIFVSFKLYIIIC